MKITIQASQAKVTPEEVRSQLTEHQLRTLQGKQVVPYMIAENGTSRPRVIGEGSKVLQWTRRAVQAVKAKLKPKTELYHLHNEDNSKNNREPVGEVVTSYSKELGSKTQTIAIACLYDETSDYDVCSIEADIYEENGIVEDVENVSAIAVGNSAYEQPAFENARRLSAPIQCFDSVEPNSRRGEKTMGTPTKEELMALPLTTLKELVKDRQLHPKQIFEWDDIVTDKIFGEKITELSSTKEKLTAKEEELAQLLKKNEEQATQILKLGSKEALAKVMPKNLTEKQKEFIVSRFSPEQLGTLEETKLKEHVDKELEEYSTYAKIFGVENISNRNSAPGEGEESEDVDIDEEDYKTAFTEK